MDNYLDTLVKKADQPSEEVSENKEEPVVVVAEVPAKEVKEEAPKAEEPVKEEPKAEEEKEEEPKAEPEIKDAEDENDAVEEEYTFMADIRVYNIPDIKSPSKVISANIKKIQEVAGMIQIEYLKQGFGLVKGYIRK